MAAQDAGAREGPNTVGRRSSGGGSGGRSAQPQRRPWRVEGAADPARGEAGPDRPTGGGGLSRFWWLFVVLFAANWIIASVMLGPQPRTAVSYTFFLDQVTGTNVAAISSTGKTIEGTSKQPVSHTPPEGGAPEQAGQDWRSPVRPARGRVRSSVPSPGTLAPDLQVAGEVRTQRPPGRRTIGWVPQDPALGLSPAVRIGTQIRDVRRAHRLSTTRDAVLATLRGVGLPDDPALLVLDEPTTGLDPATARAIFDLVRSRRDDGAALLGRVSRILTAAFAPRPPLAALSARPGIPNTTARTSAMPGAAWITKPIAQDPRDTA
jgi:hypothetical protein